MESLILNNINQRLEVKNLFFHIPIPIIILEFWGLFKTQNFEILESF